MGSRTALHAYLSSFLEGPELRPPAGEARVTPYNHHPVQVYKERREYFSSPVSTTTLVELGITGAGDEWLSQGAILGGGTMEVRLLEGDQWRAISELSVHSDVWKSAGADPRDVFPRPVGRSGFYVARDLYQARLNRMAAGQGGSFLVGYPADMEISIARARVLWRCVLQDESLVRQLQLIAVHGYNRPEVRPSWVQFDSTKFGVGITKKQMSRTDAAEILTACRDFAVMMRFHAMRGGRPDFGTLRNGRVVRGASDEALMELGTSRYASHGFAHPRAACFVRAQSMQETADPRPPPRSDMEWDDLLDWLQDEERRPAAKQAIRVVQAADYPSSMCQTPIVRVLELLLASTPFCASGDSSTMGSELSSLIDMWLSGALDERYGFTPPKPGERWVANGSDQGGAEHRTRHGALAGLRGLALALADVLPDTAANRWLIWFLAAGMEALLFNCLLLSPTGDFISSTVLLTGTKATAACHAVNQLTGVAMKIPTNRVAQLAKRFGLAAPTDGWDTQMAGKGPRFVKNDDGCELVRESDVEDYSDQMYADVGMRLDLEPAPGTIVLGPSPFRYPRGSTLMLAKNIVPARVDVESVDSTDSAGPCRRLGLAPLFNTLADVGRILSLSIAGEHFARYARRYQNTGASYDIIQAMLCVYVRAMANGVGAAAGMRAYLLEHGTPAVRDALSRPMEWQLVMLHAALQGQLSVSNAYERGRLVGQLGLASHAVAGEERFFARDDNNDQTVGDVVATKWELQGPPQLLKPWVHAFRLQGQDVSYQESGVVGMPDAVLLEAEMDLLHKVVSLSGLPENWRDPVSPGDVVGRFPTGLAMTVLNHMRSPERVPLMPIVTFDGRQLPGSVRMPRGYAGPSDPVWSASSPEMRALASGVHASLVLRMPHVLSSRALGRLGTTHMVRLCDAPPVAGDYREWLEWLADLPDELAHWQLIRAATVTGGIMIGARPTTSYVSRRSTGSRSYFQGWTHLTFPFGMPTPVDGFTAAAFVRVARAWQGRVVRSVTAAWLSSDPSVDLEWTPGGGGPRVAWVALLDSASTDALKVDLSRELGLRRGDYDLDDFVPHVTVLYRPADEVVSAERWPDRVSIDPIEFRLDELKYTHVSARLRAMGADDVSGT